MDNINIITKNIRLIPSYYINVVYLITKFHISFLGLYSLPPSNSPATCIATKTQVVLPRSSYFRMAKAERYVCAGAELPWSWGGGVSPQKKKKLLKKKKKLINFTPKFCYFYSFGPPNFFFFNLAPPNLGS
jgi:hypothetical protein